MHQSSGLWWEVKVSSYASLLIRSGSKVANEYIIGNELVMLRLAQEALEKAEWPTEVLTGRFMFHVGNNDRNSVKQSETTTRRN